MTPDQETRLSRLEAFMANMQAASRVPYEVEQALKTRIVPSIATIQTQTTKTSSSENVNIDEGGAATHTVLDNPDAFLLVTLTDGTVRYIPAWTS